MRRKPDPEWRYTSRRWTLVRNPSVWICLTANGTYALKFNGKHAASFSTLEAAKDCRLIPD